jgi:hypothetical protein
MGNSIYKEKKEAVIDDWIPEPIGYSLSLRLSSWDYPDKNKNQDYWFSNKRFTKISRGLYPNYVNGWIYGRYEIEDYYLDLSPEDEGELELAL